MYDYTTNCGITRATSTATTSKTGFCQVPLRYVYHYFHNMSCTTTVARIRQDNVYHDTGDMNIYEMCTTTRCDAKYHDDRAPLPSPRRCWVHQVPLRTCTTTSTTAHVPLLPSTNWIRFKIARFKGITAEMTFREQMFAMHEMPAFAPCSKLSLACSSSLPCCPPV